MKKILKNKKYWLIGSIGLLVICIGMIYVGTMKKENKTLTKKEDKYRLEDGIIIEDVTKYTGPFIEDGQDQEVEDVWKLTVTNTSDKDIQFLRIKAENGDETGQFDITTLTAGGTVHVLEKNKKKLPEWEKDCTYSIENIAKFSAERSIYPDLFQISVVDQQIRLVNKTEEDFKNDIYVYYKTVEENVYQGGITYRVKFEGGIRSGEIKEEQTKHFHPDTSKILYLTFE